MSNKDCLSFIITLCLLVFTLIVDGFVIVCDDCARNSPRTQRSFEQLVVAFRLLVCNFVIVLFLDY